MNFKAMKDMKEIGVGGLPTIGAPIGGGTGSGGGGGAVDSVNGKTGVVVLNATDVGAYELPENGIPASDLASGVQGALSQVATNTQNISALQEAYDSLTQGDIVPLATLPASGEANTIYRIAGTDSYSDYMWDGTQFIKIAEYNGSVGNVKNTKDNNWYNLWVGTAEELAALDGNYEDGVIYLVGSSAPIPIYYDVTKTGISEHINVSGTDASSTEARGERPYTITLTPASNYGIDSVSVTMGGIDVTSSVYNTTTGVINIASVTGDIVITATASIHIVSITLSASSQSGNIIPLSASVSPSSAQNVTLSWSVPSGTTKFSISGDGISATLSLLSGAEAGDSVVVTCTDINASSGTATATLTVTATSDYSDSVPITEITDISATRTAANTLDLFATADGNTPAISYSIVGTIPIVKQVRRWSSGDTIDGVVKDEDGHDTISVNAVALNGTTLIYKGDCQVQIKATSGEVEYTKTLTIEHNTGDNIWFEDSEVVSALNSHSIGSGGNVTYAQAASATNLKFFAGNTSIIRFREFWWFTSISSIGSNNSDKGHFANCSNLECIGLPYNITLSSSVTLPFSGCALKELHIKSYEDYSTVTFGNGYYGWTTGRSSSGIGLFINYEEIYDVVLPENCGISYRYAGLNHITSFTAEYQSYTPAQAFKGCSSLASLKFGNSFTSLPERCFQDNTSLVSVDLGSGISALSLQLFRGCTGLRTLTLRYDGVVTNNNSFYLATAITGLDLYVPSNQVSAYQASSTWGNAKSINAITE